MSTASIIKVIFSGDEKGLRSATQGAIGDLDKTAKKGTITSGQVKAGFAIVGTAALAFGVSSMKMADTFDVASTRLHTAVKNNGEDWDDYGGKVDSAINKGTDFGFNAIDIVGALGQMSTSFGSTQKALDALQLAEDIAAKQGIPLADAATLVTKAQQGSLKPLKALGLDLPIAAGGAQKLAGAQKDLAAAHDLVKSVEQKIKDGRLVGAPAAAALAAANDKVKDAQKRVNDATGAGDTIITALSKKFSGSAAANADTYGGKVDKVSAKFDNLKIKVGLLIEKGLVGLDEFYEKKAIPWLKKFGAAIDDQVAKVQNFLGVVSRGLSAAGGALSDFFVNTDTHTSEAKAHQQADNYDKAKGYPKGTTWAKSKKALGFALGGKVPGPIGLPHVAVVHGGEEISTPAQQREGGGGTTVVHMYLPAGVDPNAVVAAQQRFARRNGVPA